MCIRDRSHAKQIWEASHKFNGGWKEGGIWKIGEFNSLVVPHNQDPNQGVTTRPPKNNNDIFMTYDELSKYFSKI
jgi:hypothetical protein